MKIAFVISIILFAGMASADQLEVHGRSMHIVAGEFNQINSGFGWSNDEYTAGFYLNSYRKDTVYLAIRKNVYCKCFGYEAGLATGYDNYPVMVALFYQFENVKIRLIPGAFTFSYVIKLSD